MKLEFGTNCAVSTYGRYNGISCQKATCLLYQTFSADTVCHRLKLKPVPNRFYAWAPSSSQGTRRRGNVCLQFRKRVIPRVIPRLACRSVNHPLSCLESRYFPKDQRPLCSLMHSRRQPKCL